jgi:hypothetical protein
MSNSRLYINVKASFDLVQKNIIINISVNYDTKLTIVWVKPIVYSTIWSYNSSRLSYLTNGTALMNEGTVKNFGIIDYNSSIINSFIGLTGFYIDFTTLSLGTVLFNTSCKICSA